jgi:hypothetical protein
VGLFLERPKRCLAAAKGTCAVPPGLSDVDITAAKGKALV